MEKGRIIFLNGVTSSGKTSIVEALQERDEVFFYVVANDLFQEMVGDKYLRENYWKYLSETIIMMYHTAKLYSDMGKNVLIDGILVERDEIKPHYQQLQEILKDNPLDIVEVYCPLDICRQRNISRGDRYETQSDEQNELMAENIAYSFKVDTSIHSAEECAGLIIKALFENECSADSGKEAMITHKRAPQNGFVMLRLEDIFDSFAEEPVTITAKEENGIEEIFEHILRIRIWNQAGRCISWSIYSKDREELHNLIIRRVIWNVEKDTEIVKSMIRENREAALNLQPSLEIYKKYIPCVQANHIIRCIKNLDSETEHGFLLHKNDNPTWEWRDIEMLRLYDWGQVHLTWCTEQKNESVEEKMKELISALDSFIEKDSGYRAND